MTYSLMLSDGKLQTVGSDMQTVSGRQKLLQDLDCWFRENYRVDHHHPSYGSVLDSYIGGVVNEETAFLVRTEVIRVLTNYQQLQIKRFQENPEIYSRGELIQDIESVESDILYDSVYILAKLKTVDQALVSYSASIDI